MSQALLEIPLRTIDGRETRLAEFAGKVLLVVNTASKCGLTPQYAGLEKLHRAYRGRGFEILGFPSNDFLEQEPGTEREIADFCRTNYDVSFHLFAKTKVTGKDRHALYTGLINAQPVAASPNGRAMRERLEAKGISKHPEPEVLWNFEKFLVSRGGEVVARFAPDTPPEDPSLIAAIEREIA